MVNHLRPYGAFVVEGKLTQRDVIFNVPRACNKEKLIIDIAPHGIENSENSGLFTAGETKAGVGVCSRRRGN